MLAIAAPAALVVAALSFARGGPAAGSGDLAPVELRGRVVCVGPSSKVQPCDEAPSRFALQSSDGKLHRFLVLDVMTGMFADERVRQRELLVRVRPMPDGIEAIKVYSIVAGRVHDIDYFCEVCNIVAYAPGPCPCCRQALVLRESPMP